jgi:pimeloyl-ACP methyl ester carboxylesterase
VVETDVADCFGSVDAVGRVLARGGIQGGSTLTEGWRGLAQLQEPESRRAFLATSRSVIDTDGQRVVAGRLLPLAAAVSTLIVWGARHRIIPTWHAALAQQAIPGSGVEIFDTPGSSHTWMTHRDSPQSRGSS